MVLQSFDGTNSLWIHQKIKLLKITLKEWNSATSGSIGLIKTKLQQDLDFLDASIEEGNVSSDLLLNRNSIKEQLLSLISSEKIKWRQKCKSHWLIEGDENKGFFHRYAATKKRKRCITEILNEQQISPFLDSDIEDKFLRFYETIC